MIRTCVVEGCDRKCGGRFLRCHPCQNSLLRYGLTSIDRETLLDEQNNRCLICSEEIKFTGKRGPRANDAVVDHDHETGRVRGIVCSNCNSLLGLIDKKKIDLEKVKAYLENTPL